MVFSRLLLLRGFPLLQLEEVVGVGLVHDSVHSLAVIANAFQVGPFTNKRLS